MHGATMKMRDPNFILVTHFTPKIKLIIFLNEWGEIPPLTDFKVISPHTAQKVS
jgi:hypothetical protein